MREPDDAIALFHKMVRTPPRPFGNDFNKLLIAVQMKQYSVALHLFDEMLKRNAPVNAITLNIAITCYSQLKRPDFGFAVLGSLFKRGYEPDHVTFNALIEGLLLCGKSLEAATLLKRMLTEPLWQPSEGQCLHLISRLCEPDMFSLLEKGRRKAYFYPYTIVINSLCKDGMVDDALELLYPMADKGISPDTLTYNSIIKGLCSLSRWNEVADILKKMVANNAYPDVFTCNILVDALCKEGRVEAARHIMKQMDVEPNIVTYRALMHDYCLKGQMDEARSIFEFAVNSGMKPDITTHY